ncbi:Uu.00g070880.m01.CDS01 [Anthostomella pinea]|uniref:Uu.00g070880.m01.CDS01 n=1 Tax=Anthostomella pinea TaxID=933095 RepID=A0AAI8YNP1_9PEZI|nr:Uu.00g070880.m01.CDS01 [Anthostomella pinea]
MDYSGNEVQPFEIWHTFDQCIRLYRSLLLALGRDDSQVVALEQVDVNRALEEYGRLKIWGQQTKASGPLADSTLDMTLDYTLRHEPQVKAGLLEILGQLAYHLELALPLARKTYDATVDTSDQDSASSLSSISEYSSPSGSEDDEVAPSRVSKIPVLMSHIFEQIQLLYHLGALLRRPGLSGRYLRSSTYSANTVFRFWDLRYVEEKIRKWRKQPQTSETFTSEEETEVTEDVLRVRLTQADSMDDIAVLGRRFASANSQRRDQFRYWAKHPQQGLLAEDSTHILSSDLREGQQKTAVMPIIEDTASTMKKEEIRNVQSLKSTPTAHSFSTVARSAIFESETQAGRPRTIYAESIVDRSSTSRVPSLMATHLDEAHPDTWTGPQRLVLLDMSERPIDEQNIVACPLCPAELYLGRMMVHLAEHMEELSLFAIPQPSPDEVEGFRSDDSANSMSAKAVLSQAVSPISSLGMPEGDTGEHRDVDTSSFAILSNAAVPDNVEKITSWHVESTQGDQETQTPTSNQALKDSSLFPRDVRLRSLRPIIVPESQSICKDFMKGNCRRGPNCAARHVPANGERVFYHANHITTIGPSGRVTNPYTVAGAVKYADQIKAEAETTWDYSIAPQHRARQKVVRDLIDQRDESGVPVFWLFFSPPNVASNDYEIDYWFDSTSLTDLWARLSHEGLSSNEGSKWSWSEFTQRTSVIWNNEYRTNKNRNSERRLLAPELERRFYELVEEAKRHMSATKDPSTDSKVRPRDTASSSADKVFEFVGPSNLARHGHQLEPQESERGPETTRQDMFIFSKGATSFESETPIPKQPRPSRASRRSRRVPAASSHFDERRARELEHEEGQVLVARRRRYSSPREDEERPVESIRTRNVSSTRDDSEPNPSKGTSDQPITRDPDEEEGRIDREGVVPHAQYYESANNPYSIGGDSERQYWGWNRR